MKPKLMLLFAFTLLLCFFGKAQLAFHHPQNNSPASLIDSVGKRFLQFSPLTNDLTQSLDKLHSDSDSRPDTIVRRENAARFYLRVYHGRFNPFGIPLDSVRTIISEQHRPLQGMEKVDTIFYLQTEGIVSGAGQFAALKAGFDQINKSLKDGFTVTNYVKTRKKKALMGEGMTYYHTDTTRPLINVTWRIRNETTGVICITFFRHLVTK